MLYVCHLINGLGKDVTKTMPGEHTWKPQPWIAKSDRMHKAGDLILVWSNEYYLCILAVQGVCTRNSRQYQCYETMALPAIYDTYNLEEIRNVD